MERREQETKRQQIGLDPCTLLSTIQRMLSFCISDDLIPDVNARILPTPDILIIVCINEKAACYIHLYASYLYKGAEHSLQEGVCLCGGGDV